MVRLRRCSTVRAGAQHAHGLLAAADVDAAAGRVGVEGAQREVQRVRVQALGRHPVGIDHHIDLAVDAADAGDLRHAFFALNRARNGVVDEPGEIACRHVRRGDGIGQNRLRIDLQPLHGRRVDLARQVGARLVDALAHLVGDLLQILAQVELDLGGGDPLRDLGLDVAHAGDAGHGVLDRPRDLGLDLRRRCAVVGDHHQHARKDDVRELLDRQEVVRDRTGDHRGDEQQRHGNRVLDAPG